MTDKEVDHILKRAAEEPHAVDPALLDRISGKVLSNLQPVRPLPPAWVIALVLQLIFLGVAILGATGLGMNGIRLLTGVESGLIFWVLSSVGRLASMAAAAEMVPASRGRVDPRILVVSCTLALAAVFAILFHDYRMDRFVSEGVRCLIAGLLHAVPAGFLIWLVTRRGLTMNPVAAGVAAGTLAGMAGFGMLELHCPIQKAMHLMVWHTAVVPLSGLLGYLAGRVGQALGVKRREAELMQ